MALKIFRSQSLTLVNLAHTSLKRTYPALQNVINLEHISLNENLHFHILGESDNFQTND